MTLSSSVFGSLHLPAELKPGDRDLKALGARLCAFSYEA